MIVFATRPVPDERGEWTAGTHHRYVLELVRWGVSWLCQYKSRSDGQWHAIHADDRGFFFTRHFHLGFEHVYYDGPHCMFSLGWLHFHWNNWDCKHCLGEADGGEP